MANNAASSQAVPAGLGQDRLDKRAQAILAANGVSLV